MEDAIKELEKLIDKLLDEGKKKMMGHQVEVIKPPQVVEAKPKPSIDAKTIIETFPQEVRANVSIEITDNEYRVKLPFGAITGDKFAEVTRAIEKMGGNGLELERSRIGKYCFVLKKDHSGVFEKY
jgi:hypothetical protein